MKKKIWKDIIGYESLYEIDEFGNVRNKSSGRMLKYDVDHKGYKRYTLCDKYHNKKHRLMHRLVAAAFVNNPQNLPQVNHKDEDKFNNHYSNLEWCDNNYNIHYGTRNIRISKAMGKPVAMMDIKGHIIKTFDSLHKAAEFLRPNTLAGIFNCCKGTQSIAYGYKWKYINK